MPPLRIVLAVMADMFRNILTGYHDEERPTSVALTEARRKNIVNACEALLKSLVGPGDLLDSHVRAEFAKEAYYGAGKCSCSNDTTCLLRLTRK